MRIVEDVRSSAEAFPRVVLTVGSFDGVHRGHRRILEHVIASARERGGTAALLTLRPHPREFFTPERAPNLLTTHRKKMELLEEAGLDVVFILKFDADVAGLEPEDFISEILCARCRAEKVVVGHDFRFGKGARGDFALLEAAGPRYGFTVEQVPPVMVDGERVSSTAIRECILQGDLERAKRLLGREYSIRGEVVSGRGIGTKLGFPTANIKPHHSAVPAQGVYVAEALVAGERRPAAVNIGIAPTIRHDDLTIEAFILDFSGNIRGEDIELVLHRRLRPERKFPSYDALIAQIAKDVEDVRAYFAARPSPCGN